MVPWIFRNEAANVDELRALGKPALLVNVENSEGRELGCAVCNLQKGGPTGVNILARMMADNINVAVDRQFFAQHIRRALEHRRRCFGEAARHYRLLNAEGDLLPGVLCDRYGDVLCLQFASAAVEHLFEAEVLDALEDALQPRAIVLRRDARPDRRLERALEGPPVVARGRHEGFTTVPDLDGGAAFETDLLAEDCTPGRCFEERPLRTALASSILRRGAPSKQRVLSLFGETLGPFCAAKGAEVTLSVPSGTQGATARARAEAAGCGVLEAEVPIARLVGDSVSQAFDIVCLEPPDLAPTYGQLEEGVRQYTAWVAAAAAAAKPDGLMLVVCRSRTVTTVRFLRCVNLGIWSAGRRARLVRRWVGGPPDFPRHMALRDTGEMQAMLLQFR